MAKPDRVEDFDELEILVDSSKWRQYVSVLKKRQVYLQEEVNKWVNEKNLIEAYGALCKLKDIVKTMEMVNKRLEELAKLKK